MSPPGESNSISFALLRFTAATNFSTSSVSVMTPETSSRRLPSVVAPGS
jgi:hypothetical protein